MEFAKYERCEEEDFEQQRPSRRPWNQWFALLDLMKLGSSGLT